MIHSAMARSRGSGDVTEARPPAVPLFFPLVPPPALVVIMMTSRAPDSEVLFLKVPIEPPTKSSPLESGLGVRLSVCTKNK